MNFISISFLLFVLAACVVYFLAPLKYRWCVLLAASYLFYLVNGAGVTLFLLLSTAITFLAGLALGKADERTEHLLKTEQAGLPPAEKKAFKERRKKTKRRILIAALVSNIGLLVVLKYGGFLIENANAFLGLFGFGKGIPEVGFLLPLGISFYTLQSAGYVLDVYRKKYQPDRNFFQYALFVSWFPQIVQGPIARHSDLAHQLCEPHRFDYARVTQGAQRILWGFMKKLVVAEWLSPYVSAVFSKPQEYSGNAILLMGCVYGLQAYADFCGGMDIACGVSELFGITLAENFRRPYFARSLQEFWQRWHITLGAWMKDYVFYTLSLSKRFFRLGKRLEKYFGKNAGRRLPTFFAMFTVFLLVGIWHGAAWRYVAYGLYNGIIISGSILLEPVYAKVAGKLHLNTGSWYWRGFQMLRTLLLCSFGRFLSRSASLRRGLVMMKRTLFDFSLGTAPAAVFGEVGWAWGDIVFLILTILVLLVVGILHEKGIHIREMVAGQPLPLRWGIYLGALLILAVWGVYGPGYVVGEFIYEQF